MWEPVKMTEIDFEIALTQFAQTHGIQIAACARNENLYANGVFTPSYWGSKNTTKAPCITYRTGHMDSVCVLAHEIGHGLDAQERPWAFHAAYHYGTPMSRLDLEMRAWDKALCLLDAFGWADWETFDQSRGAGLKVHYGFGWRELPLELRPGFQPT